MENNKESWATSSNSDPVSDLKRSIEKAFESVDSIAYSDWDISRSGRDKTSFSLLDVKSGKIISPNFDTEDELANWMMQNWRKLHLGTH